MQNNNASQQQAKSPPKDNKKTPPASMSITIPPTPAISSPSTASHSQKPSVSQQQQQQPNLLNISPALRAVMDEVVPIDSQGSTFSNNINMFHAANFDPIAALNELFPNPDSCQAELDPFLYKIKRKLLLVNREISESVRRQAKAHVNNNNNSTSASNNTSSAVPTAANSNNNNNNNEISSNVGEAGNAVIDGAQRQIEQLSKRMLEIKQRAEQSESMAEQITREIKTLDAAKKHLRNSITMLQNVNMLVSAISQLRESVRSREYSRVGNLFQVRCHRCKFFILIIYLLLLFTIIYHNIIIITIGCLFTIGILYTLHGIKAN